MKKFFLEYFANHTMCSVHMYYTLNTASHLFTFLFKFNDFIGTLYKHQVLPKVKNKLKKSMLTILAQSKKIKKIPA